MNEGCCDDKEELKESSPRHAGSAPQVECSALDKIRSFARPDIEKDGRRPDALDTSSLHHAATAPSSEPVMPRNVSPLRAFVGFFSRSFNGSWGAEGAVEGQEESREEDVEEGVMPPSGGKQGGGSVDANSFFCLICFEHFRPAERMPPAKQEGGTMCDHAFCRGCARSYLETRINSGLTSHPCPMLGDQWCTGFWGEEDIAAVLSETWLKKQVRFSTMKSSDDYRECPNPACLHLMRGDKKRPKMTCMSCGTEFCFHHANAHPPGVSCRAFASRTRKDERLSKKTVKRISKPCPNRACRAPTEKNGGCNHISCSRCRFEWCWLCGGRYAPNHYSRSNLLTGCPGAQYLDCGSATCCTAFCIRALRLFIITVLLPLPLLSGLLLASLASLLYLPIGTSLLLLRHSPLASAALSSSRLHHQQAIDVAFPLRKRLMSGRYLSSRLLNLALLGISPVILLAAIVIQVLWLPFGLGLVMHRLSKRRRGSYVSIMLMPLVAVGLLFEDDD